MYTLDDVKDSGHPVHAHHPWAKDAVADFAATVATEQRGGFPCNFSPAALRRRTLSFAFIDDVHEYAVADSAEGEAVQIARGCPLRRSGLNATGHARRRDAT